VTARPHEPPDVHADTPLCFRHLTAGDLLIDGRKVVGSAQRKQRGALMQHGGILLAQGPFTPELPGIRELTGHDLGIQEICPAIGRAFARETGRELAVGEWGAGLRRIEELAEGKYGRREWNDRR